MLTRLAHWRAHSPTKLLPKQHALRTQCEGSACTFYSNHHNSTSACKALAATQVVVQTEEAQPGGPVFWAKNEAETGLKGVARKLHASSSPWRYNTITSCTGPCQSRRHVAKLGCKTRSTVTPKRLQRQTSRIDHTRTVSAHTRSRPRRAGPGQTKPTPDGTRLLSFQARATVRPEQGNQTMTCQSQLQQVGAYKPTP